MDRAIVYDGQTPQTTDILQTNKTNLVGMGFFLQALLGTNVAVNGLACTQTSPSASTSVTVAPGSIYTTDTVDTTAYSDLPTDSAVIVKQGILYNAVNLTPVFTGTSGQSQNFLVEAKFTDADGGSAVVPYYNASNPASPLWGSNFATTPAAGTPQNTARTSVVTVQLKAGTPATTGSQTTPAVDAGYTALYVISLAFGYGTISNANITQVATAPFFPNLPAIPNDLQTELWTYAADTGAVNALVATLNPAPASLVAGLTVQIKVANTNTSTATLNLNGLGAKAIHRGSTGAVLSAGDLTAGEIALFSYDGTNFQLVNYPNTFGTTQTNTFNTFPVCYAVDFGTPNNIVVHANTNRPQGLGTNSPPGPIVNLYAGLTIAVKARWTNTGRTTITINSLTPVYIVDEISPVDVLAPTLRHQQWASIIGGEVVYLTYDGTYFRKLPKKFKYFFYDVAEPPPWPPIWWPIFWDPFWPEPHPWWPPAIWPVFWPPPLPATIAASPNVTPGLLPLNVGDQLNVNFENTQSVPLRVAVVPGIYELDVIIYACNSHCCDFWHWPNDTCWLPPPRPSPWGPPGCPPLYLGQIPLWYLQALQLEANIVSPNQPPPPQPAGPWLSLPLAQQPWIWRRPQLQPPFPTVQGLAQPRPPFQCFPHHCWEDVNFNFLNTVFGQACDPDICFGRFPPFNPFNDQSQRGRPPIMWKMTIVTFPNFKHIRVHGGCFGGPFHHFCRWHDITTSWWSLGTFVLAIEYGHRNCPFPIGPHHATISGHAVVRRLA